MHYLDSWKHLKILKKLTQIKKSYAKSFITSGRSETQVM
jgi:hypothetical protein